MSKYKVGGYVRLSRDDDYSESDSIQRQMDLIKIIANIELDCELKEFYVDNGYSGTSLDRPGFNRLLDDITQGKINMIMVKDLSRLGRNHIEVNKYIEDIFPSLNVRVLSINDNYDSLKTKNSNGEDILSGYFKCKDCGESMYIKKGKNKDYYYCRSYITNGLCTNHSIEKNKLYDEILKQMNLKRVESKEIKKLTRNRIVKYIDNIFIHEDKSIEINFKEDINSI